MIRRLGGCEFATTSKEVREAIAAAKIPVELMKRGNRYVFVYGTWSLYTHARALYNYTLEEWVTQARVAHRSLRMKTLDSTVGREPVEV